MKSDLSLHPLIKPSVIKEVFITLVLAALFLFGGGCLFSLHAEEQRSPWLFSGYLESYLQHDHNDPSSHRRPDFIYSHDVLDRPAINLAMLKAALNTQVLRGNLALGSGTYMRANYAAEPAGLQHLFEANVGLKLSTQHALWLDIGVMPSHIGAESAIGSDNWTLTRSLMADNSPYFQTGAKLGYTSDDGRWQLAGLVLTGWQRIHRPNDNTTPALGHQLVYTPNETLTLTSSSFIGNDKSDAERQMRYFHHGNVRWQLSPELSLLVALDVGAQQTATDPGRYQVWLGQSTLLRYQLSPRLAVAGRVEYYQDRHQVIVATHGQDGFQTMGYSVNIDYAITSKVLWRNELRYLNSAQANFSQQVSGAADRLTNDSLSATTALTLSF